MLVCPSVLLTLTWDVRLLPPCCCHCLPPCHCIFSPLDLQPLLGQPVMVKPAEAEKNLAWEAAQAAKAAAPPDADLIALGLGAAGADLTALALAAAAPPPLPEGPLRLQVAGFKQGLGENEIRQIMEPFGALDSVSVVHDAAGQPQSIAHVVFRSATDGRAAMGHWNGLTLLDHVLSVTEVPLDSSGTAAAMAGAFVSAAAAAGPPVGAGELDDADGGLKIDGQVRRGDAGKVLRCACVCVHVCVGARACVDGEQWTRLSSYRGSVSAAD